MMPSPLPGCSERAKKNRFAAAHASARQLARIPESSLLRIVSASGAFRNLLPRHSGRSPKTSVHSQQTNECLSAAENLHVRDTTRVGSRARTLRTDIAKPARRDRCLFSSPPPFQAGDAEDLLIPAQPLFLAHWRPLGATCNARDCQKPAFQLCSRIFVLQGTEPAANAHRNWKLAPGMDRSSLRQSDFAVLLHRPGRK